MTRTRSWSASFSNLLSPRSAHSDKDKDGQLRLDTFTSMSDAHIAGPSGDSPHPPPASRSSRSVSSRPRSIVQPYQPPLMDVAQDTLPELQPIFAYLYDHSKKLYVEGYFLKLADLNPDGKPSPDRSWVECFAQLVGTVLSLWDAAELDAAGQDKEVVPTFLNLTDASIKMIESLPTRSPDVPPLTNVLSISTAGRNRYLFHFNSHHSLTQWTAGIRLSMYEHASLQEAYTGALIAGKGKSLNSITTIMEKTRFKHEDWARVRFGAGTPWRRCWAVISPPSEKTVKKLRAAMKAPKSAYQAFPPLKGDIKFYDTKKSKKAQPIATITDAFSAYAIYPQSKPLIDQSTLVKIEGRITIHTDPPSSSEGFVFFMPETHPAVSGFEIMLRWLFPTFDVFSLYGRPTRLVADTNDVRSLMFAMPQDHHISYLDVSDVTNLIVAEGSNIIGEAEWRRKLKELTAEKMRSGGRKARTSLPAAQRFPGVTFEDGVSSRSSSSLPIPISQLPPQHVPLGTPPMSSSHFHQRSTSEATGYLNYQRQGRTLLSLDTTPKASQGAFDVAPSTGKSEDSSSDDGLFQGPIDPAARRLQQQAHPPSPDSVPITPEMTHPPSSKPLHLPQGRQLQHQISSNSLNFAGGLGASFRNDFDRRPSPQYSPEIEPRRSTESNMFEGVVPTRRERVDSVPPPPAFSSAIGSFQPDTQGNVYNPVYPSQQSQITAQSSLSCQPPIEPPPGFALQSSQVLLAGPPATGDEKIAYEEGYANRPPPAPINASQLPNSVNLTAQVPSHKRFSWQESEAPTPVLPDQTADSPGDYGSRPAEVPRNDGLDPLHSPPIPAKTSLRSLNTPKVPALQTNIARKPVPTQPQVSGTPGDESPDTPESLGSFTAHLINEDALDKIGTRRNDSNSQVDEDTLDRRTVKRMQRMLNDSGSEYDDDSEPDYASIDSTHEVVPVRDTTQPRAGKMKVVGKAPEPEVVVGDAHYRHNYTAKPDLQVPEIPKVDFGITVNHGRSLSADHKGVNRGNGQVVEPDHYPASQHGTLIGGDPRRQSQVLSVDMWGTHQRASSRSSIGSEDRRRESWNRMSPEYGHERGGSQSSDSDQSKRRSMQWQPGMAQIGSRSPDRREGAEPYISDKAIAVQQQSRSRYAHQRKASGQLLSTGQRPGSRGGNAAFIPNGLVSSSADLSSHLSAREQEYVAKQTGSTLLHLDNGKPKQPSHQTGLLGAIETREMEKKQMKDAWNSSITVQQAIAQRQQQQQQQQYQKGGAAPSPRPLGPPSTAGYGQGPNYDAGSYFSAQQQQQGHYAPQQQQQPGNQYYNPQGQGFGQYYQGGQQYSRN